MQALRIHAHGGPEVLSIDDVPEPGEPGSGEVLVRVLAVSINHLDLWVRRGIPGLRVAFPLVLGCDGTGEVVAVGPGVEHVSPGQTVVLEPGYSSGESAFDARGDDHLAPDYGIRGEHGDGFGQELVRLPARFVFPLPEGVDPLQAAAVPLVFLTAWGMLVDRARLAAGERVLVIGGSSGVGSAAIQIAKERGATVIATAGSEAKRALCTELGADHVVDHGDEDWDREVRALTDKAGCDVVFEHVGPATWSRSLRSLARLGRLVTCGGTTGPEVAVQLPHLFIKNQSILGSTMGPRRALPLIFEHVAAGRYRPVVHEIAPLREAPRAHADLERRAVVGKVVLVPGA